MFRVTLFVDDKNLGELFKRLAGIARDLEHQYVPNVEAGGKPNGATPKIKLKAGDTLELFTKEARQRKLTEIDTSQAKSIISDLGFSPTSYSYFLSESIKRGFLKRGPKKGMGFVYRLTDK
jgi:hypothetical protein